MYAANACALIWQAIPLHPEIAEVVMRAEAQTLVDEIKSSLALLRRHL